MKNLLNKYYKLFSSEKKYQYAALAVIAVIIIFILIIIFSGKNNAEKSTSESVNNSSYLKMDTVNKIDVKCQVLGADNNGADEFSAKLDLNSDGNTDTVKFYCEKDDGDSWVDNSRIVIEINGKPFVLYGHFFYVADYSDESYNDSDVVFKGIPENLFYLVDIDKKDSFVEIAISYDNENGYPQTNFYRYDGENLSKVSQLYTYIRSTDFDYNGNLTCCSPLIEVAKWFGDIEYTFNSDGSFTKICKYYEGRRDCDTSASDSKDYLTVKIKDFLFAYSKPDDTLKADILNSQSVILLGSDEENWVKCKAEDGKIYWFKCSLITESDQAFLNDMATNPAEIFQGEAIDALSM